MVWPKFKFNWAPFLLYLRILLLFVCFCSIWQTYPGYSVGAQLMLQLFSSPVIPDLFWSMFLWQGSLDHVHLNPLKGPLKCRFLDPIHNSIPVSLEGCPRVCIFSKLSQRSLWHQRFEKQLTQPWSCLSNTTLQIRCQPTGYWSPFISYHAWDQRNYHLLWQFPQKQNMPVSIFQSVDTPGEI